MNKAKYIQQLDFDELKEICLNQSGPSTEVYISIVYYLVTQEIGHKLTQTENKTVFELLPQTQKVINVLCDKIHFLYKIALDNTDITQVNNKESAQVYIASLSGNRSNDIALNYTFELIDKANILIEKDKLNKKIEKSRKSTERPENTFKI